MYTMVCRDYLYVHSTTIRKKPTKAVYMVRWYYREKNEEEMKRPESKHGKLIAVYSSRYGWTLKKSEKTQKSVGKKKSENKGKSWVIVV